MKYIQLFIHFASILLGGLIYICYRTTDLLMFKWLNNLNLSSAIFNFRNYAKVYKIKNSDWIIYSLPDGLWMFSFITIILYIWRNTITRKNIVWIIVMPIIALTTELSQKYHLIKGTYDSNDILAYLIGFFLSCISFSNCFEIIKIKVN